MVTKYKDHSLKVDAWIKAATAGLLLLDLIDLFELATARLWWRGCITVSDVTLAAVGDRARFNSVEAYPALHPLKVDSTGIQWSEFRKSSAKLSRNELIRASAYFITEFIAIASSITDEILSAPLHQELATVALKKKKRP